MFIKEITNVFDSDADVYYSIKSSVVQFLVCGNLQIKKKTGLIQMTWVKPSAETVFFFTFNHLFKTANSKIPPISGLFGQIHTTTIDKTASPFPQSCTRLAQVQQREQHQPTLTIITLAGGP